ncbi:hypothetical protein BpHYR1_011639 [Brachionus plicatilis]|uniref:Uncharacterized protein n=1 Tax=Brachionus plicatilis TaxID=10195 RepID=A0A3M7RTZ4_BRAPC|nr:hypothetical protein BpHYR1_011639 [Brachionus plicatilis]
MFYPIHRELLLARSMASWFQQEIFFQHLVEVRDIDHIDNGVTNTQKKNQRIRVQRIKRIVEKYRDSDHIQYLNYRDLSEMTCRNAVRKLFLILFYKHLLLGMTLDHVKFDYMKTLQGLSSDFVFRIISTILKSIIA